MQDKAVETASVLYGRYITDTGFTAPETYADLLLFVEFSGATVYCAMDAPPGFCGIQIDEWIHVNGSGELSERERMHVLAHEWCHWLRRHSSSFRRLRFYQSREAGGERDAEEAIACVFQHFFDM